MDSKRKSVDSTDQDFKSLGDKKLSLVQKLGVKERAILGLIKKITRTKEPIVIPKSDPPIDMKNQSVHIPSDKGEYILRRAGLKEGKLITGFRQFNTIPEMFFDACKKHTNKPFHGTRKVLKEIPETLSDGRVIKKMILTDFIWKSYDEVKDMILNLSGFLLKLGYKEGDKVGIFADTHSEWFISSVAINTIHAIIVTVYATLSDEAIIYALQQTELEAIIVDSKSLARLVSLKKQLPNIKSIICLSECESVDSTLSKDIKILKPSDKFDFESVDLSKSVNFYSWQLVMSSGRKHYLEINFKYNKQERTALSLIMYTSGSTGMPKGVMIQHKSILATVGAATFVKPEIWHNQIYPAYLPLAHSFEFIAENTLTYFGGKIGYCRPTTLTDNSPMVGPNCKGDLTLLKPSISIFVPLLLERLKKGIIEKITQRGKLPSALIEYGYNRKYSLREAGFNAPKVDKIIFKKIRQVVGGDLRYVIIGSAPLPLQTEEFVNICFGGAMKQGYGLTETCIAGTLSNFDDLSFGSCGPPMGSVDLKLVPWVEGGYSPDDKPNPRGEIALSGDSVALGYFKQPELTDEAFKIDIDTGVRWFYTGDIGEALPNGTVKIIDRKKDIVKLKHGEYISLVQVESSLTKNPYIEFLCVLPSLDSDHLVLFVVPSRTASSDLVSSLNLPKYDTITEAFDHPSFKKAVADSILETAKESKLNKFELPKVIHLVKEYWTPDTNLVTPTMKTKRPEIARYYKEFL